MLKKEKNLRKYIFKSKYMYMDLEDLSDEEYIKISKKVYISIALRSGGGVMLFTICIIALILGGKYAW